MTVFCSAREFEALCRDITGRARTLRLQAKGGSMFPVIRSGEWVEAALGAAAGDIRKGDILLFKRDSALYLHRVVGFCEDGLVMKGDMAGGSEDVVPPEDILGRAVFVERNGRKLDLRAQVDLHLFLRLPVRWFELAIRGGEWLLSRVQGIRWYRAAAGACIGGDIRIRPANEEDEEGLRDLYLMTGHDIRESIERARDQGFWFVAEKGRRLAGGLTITRCDAGSRLWFISGLEVKALFRGAGIGRRLVNEAVETALREGAQEIGLFSLKKRRVALAFYKRLGFEMDSVPPELHRSPDEIYLSYRRDGRRDLEGSLRDGMFYPYYKGLPPEQRESLGQEYYLYLARSIELESAVQAVLDRLESLSIEALLFKGAAVDRYLYDGLMRPRLDLDLWVRAQDDDRLAQGLKALGYSVSEYPDSRLFVSATPGLVPVHAHRHLINNTFLTVDGFLGIDMENVRRETEPFKGCSHVRTLKPEINIIYLCEHGLKHDFRQRVFLYEIGTLLSSYASAFDWKKLVSLAFELGLDRPAYYGLLLTKEGRFADVPAYVLTALAPRSMTRGERRFLRDMRRGRHRRYASYPVYLAMRRGTFRKARFVFRTLFPPRLALKAFLSRILTFFYR
ncbi:MAG: GNAT family N-acetyltransferase [Deltaproteobacteria bacterium]